jgi:hypothetical protein
MKSAWRLLPIWLVLAGPVAVLEAQISGLSAPESYPGRRGLTLNSVFVSAQQFALAAPAGQGTPFENLPLGSDFGGASGCSLSWSRSGRRTSLFSDYTMSYTAAARYSALNALNQYASIGLRRQATPHWTVSMGAAGVSAGMASFVFSPTESLRLAHANTSFDELAGAVLSGTTTNNELASILTGGMAPLRTILFGTRTRSAGADLSLNYAPSTRLNWHTTASASLNEYLAKKREDIGSKYLVPRTEGIGVVTGISYSLTPRTDIGFDLEENRGYSRLQDAYFTSASANFGRKLSQRWFLQVTGGAGVITPLHEQTHVPRSVQYLAGGRTGYKTRSHTFLLSGQRSLGDHYGLGGGNTNGGSLAWDWQTPGRNWGFSSSVSYERLGGNTYLSLSGWLIQAGFNRRMSPHSMAIAEFVYSTNGGGGGQGIESLQRRAVRLTYTWTPDRRLLR